jgi:hypothetical protein
MQLKFKITFLLLCVACRPSDKLDNVTLTRMPCNKFEHTVSDFKICDISVCFDQGFDQQLIYSRADPY